MKNVVHKIKWQVVTLQGWYLRQSQIKPGYRALCCDTPVRLRRLVKHYYGHLYYMGKRGRIVKEVIGNGAFKWAQVTCKKCLKMRRFK